MVDGNMLDCAVGTVPEVSQLAAAGFADGELKRVFMPQVPTILHRCDRQLLL